MIICSEYPETGRSCAGFETVTQLNLANGFRDTLNINVVISVGIFYREPFYFFPAV